MKKQATNQNYVDNARLLEELKVYKRKLKETQEQGKPKPRISDYIGKCIMDIAENLLNIRNKYGGQAFAGYTESWKQEMLSDGIENVLIYIDNFNPEKYNNPFAYITKIIYYAYLRRIAKEKKQLYIKYKVAANYGIFDAVTAAESEGENAPFELYDNLATFIEEFETKKEEKKVKKTKDFPITGNDHHKAMLYDIMLPNNAIISVSTLERKAFCKAHDLNWETLKKHDKVGGYIIVNKKPIEELTANNV